MTPNARKNAARAYQRRHHVPYTEALRAVTPAGTLGDNDPHRGVPSPDRRLLDALQIADPATHSPTTAWHQHAADRDLTLPIATAIDEPTTAATLHLDAANSVIALLAIPGTGKTAALRTITLALCASYPPERVTFACAGGKWGFLHGITALPHLAVHCFDTWDNRDDVHPDVAKWCAYIDDEIDRRTTTTHAGLEPELVIVVDDLDEFLEPNPAAAATVQRIIDRGPDLGIRLIVSTKQLHPDGDLWTVPAFGPAVRFRPDTVIAFSTFRREESMAPSATRAPGACSAARATPTSDPPPNSATPRRTSSPSTATTQQASPHK